MGIFFRSTPVVVTRTETAHTEGAPASAGGGVVYEQMQQELAPATPSTGQSLVYWGRILFALVVLVLLAGGSMYCYKQGPALAEWADLLKHSFELLFGGFVGLLTGEAVHSNK